MRTLGVADQLPIDPSGQDQGDNGGFNIVSSTLTNVGEGVDPNPNGTTLGLGSADQSRNGTPEQTQPSNRDPVQDAANGEGVGPGVAAQIRIVIRRPGGQQ